MLRCLPTFTFYRFSSRTFTLLRYRCDSVTLRCSLRSIYVATFVAYVGGGAIVTPYPTLPISPFGRYTTLLRFSRTHDPPILLPISHRLHVGVTTPFTYTLIFYVLRLPSYVPAFTYALDFVAVDFDFWLRLIPTPRFDSTLFYTRSISVVPLRCGTLSHVVLPGCLCRSDPRFRLRCSTVTYVCTFVRGCYTLLLTRSLPRFVDFDVCVRFTLPRSYTFSPTFTATHAHATYHHAHTYYTFSTCLHHATFAFSRLTHFTLPASLRTHDTY